MTKEIKFRAWDGKRMYYDVQNAYDDFVCNDEDEKKYGGYQYTYNAGFSFQSFQDVLEEAKAVMQYTGLKDKNGKELFEGDIIRENVENGFGSFTECVLLEVYFNTAIAAFRAKDELDKMFDWSIGRNCEIVGNIYEGLHSGEKTDILGEWKKDINKQSQEVSKDTKSAKKLDEKSD